MFNKKIYLFLFAIFLISLASANSITFVPNPNEANVNIEYQINLTNSSTECGSNVTIASKTEIVTTNSRGFGIINMDISNLSQIPTHICEIKDNSIRKIHQTPDLITNKIYAQNIETKNIKSSNWSNVTIQTSQITDFSSGDVNSSDYWDNLDVPSDLNNLILLDWSNITNKVPSDFNDRILLKEANITDLQNYIVNNSNGNVANFSEAIYQNGNLVCDNSNNCAFILQSEEGNLDVNSSQFLITNEGSIDNIADILGSDITNDLNWINQTLGNATYILQNNEGNLNVNSSEYWDGLNTPSDISTGDLTDDGTYIKNNTNNGYVGIFNEVDIGTDWDLRSTTFGGILRLLIESQGTNLPVELFLSPKGTSRSSRITLSNNPSPSNFNAIQIGSDENKTFLDSEAEGTGTALPFYIQQDGENVISVINGSHNVGINTTTPQNTLNVIGDGNFTGKIYAGDWSDANNRITLKEQNITNENWIEDSQESSLNVNSSDKLTTSSGTIDNINTTQLEVQSGNLLGIKNSFVNILIDNRVTQSFVQALGFLTATESNNTYVEESGDEITELNVTTGINLENNATISRSDSDTETWQTKSGNLITKFG